MNILGTTANESPVDSVSAGHGYVKESKHGAGATSQSGNLNPNATEFKPDFGSKPDPGAGRSNTADAARDASSRRSNRGNKGSGRGRGGHSSRPRGALSQSFRSSKTEQIRGDWDVNGDGGVPLARSPNPNSRAYVPANHLLNFQYAARGRADGSGRGASRRPPPANRSWRGAPARPLKYDKTKFVQANFRFLVSDAVDTSYYLADADRMFDWEDIIQVEMLSTIPVQCPISLESPPICPQITPCGHIFSFPAIMHHLMNKGGEQLRSAGPCPLCFQPIVARELRYVAVRQVTAPKVGDRIEFVALQRPHNSIIPRPAVAEDSGHKQSGNEYGRKAAWVEGMTASECHDTAFDLFASNRFAKFITAGSNVELWRPAAQELAQYAAKVINEGGMEAEYEAPYVYAAMEQLGLRARNWGVRRAELLDSPGVIGAVETSSNDTLKQGMALEAAVKQVFTTAMKEACKSFNSQVLRTAHEADYPSLAVANTAQSNAAAPAPQPISTSASTPPKSKKSPRGEQKTQAESVSKQAESGGLEVEGGQAEQKSAAESASGWGDQARLGSKAKSNGDLSSFTEGRLNMNCSRDVDLAQQLPPDEDAMLGMVSADTNADAEFHFQAAFSDDEELGGESLAQPAPSGSSFTSKSSQDKIAAYGAHALGASASPPSEGFDLLSQSPSTNPFNMTSHDGQYHMYQAADGQWLFLDPVNLKILAHYFGGFSGCPAHISGTVLEIEDMVQLESTRKKLKFLSHLPLTGVFKFLEIDLSEHISPEGLAPFQEELQMREKRRKRKAELDKKRKQKEAAAAAARAAARQGPSEQELKSMPLPSASLTLEDGVLTPEQLEEGIALQESLDNAAALGTSPQTESGVSFARITKMGYVARGPALGSSPPSPSVSLMGAWANKDKPVALSAAGTAPNPPKSQPKSGIASLASLLAASSQDTIPGTQNDLGPFASTTGSVAAKGESGTTGTGSGGSAKKGKKVLLFSTASHRQ